MRGICSRATSAGQRQGERRRSPRHPPAIIRAERPPFERGLCLSSGGIAAVRARASPDSWGEVSEGGRSPLRGLAARGVAEGDDGERAVGGGGAHAAAV